MAAGNMEGQPMNEEQVDKWGRLFARIMDKRDGTGSQEAVDAAIDEVMGGRTATSSGHPRTSTPSTGAADRDNRRRCAQWTEF